MRSQAEVTEQIRADVSLTSLWPEEQRENPEQRRRIMKKKQKQRPLAASDSVMDLFAGSSAKEAESRVIAGE
ncbi:unnamed protein product [Pleuronectes platessa]|uniref:Uncharacterized protein n=1 Tax=Pleuronectes platessa TaxID=8262 RepID=A0A9N7YN19_PLEPL|nr:unnamed protein product [Pleuronectes platessa]